MASHKHRVFPRHLELPSPSSQPPNFTTLAQKHAKPSDITDPQYWRKLCPELTVLGEGKKGKDKPIDWSSDTRQSDVVTTRQQVDAEGATVVHSDQIPWRGLDFAALARSVVTLLQYGWPASFIMMYDEVWSLIQQLDGLMVAATGNSVNMDILAWYIDPNEGAAGFSPHRDRQPPNSPATFRPDGSAMYTTAWVPFTDACPDNSCLYVLPRWADPGYYEGDKDDGPDPLPLALETKESYQNLRALPAEAGAAVIFTHRIIHWGSKGRVGYHTPRISLSFGCADDSYEPPYFDRAAHLPYPSLAMRAALVSGQMIVYHERFDLTPKQLATFRRIFGQHSDQFHPSYQSKVLEEYVAASKDVTERHLAKTQPTPATDAPNGISKQPSSSSQGNGVAAHGSEQAQGQGQGSKGETQGKKSKEKKAGKGKSVDTGGSAGADHVADGSAPAGGSGHDKADSKKKKKEKDKNKQPDGLKQQVAVEGSKAKKRAATVAAVEEEEDEDEDEGPGFDVLLGGDEVGSDVDSDVDLLDDALDAVLEARLAGFDDVQDDFGSDMEEEGEDSQDDFSEDFEDFRDDYVDSDTEGQQQTKLQKLQLQTKPNDKKKGISVHKLKAKDQARSQSGKGGKSGGGMKAVNGSAKGEKKRKQDSQETGSGKGTGKQQSAAKGAKKAKRA